MAEGTNAAERIAALVRRAQAGGRDFSVEDAVLSLDVRDVAAVLHARLAHDQPRALFTTGLPASPGAATGVLVLSAEAAITASADGVPAILVRRETSADDVIGMHCAQGIVTAHGGVSSHAAVVARGLGVPAVVGAHQIEILPTAIRCHDTVISAGEWLAIDGSSGEVFAGAVDVARHEPIPELDTLLGWADQLAAHRLVVRANADTPDDAAFARHAGARGIGLCRTEHMFFAPERLALLRQILFSTDVTDERRALVALEDFQADDFEQILAAMDGLHVSIRLLDAPLHEFAPAAEADTGRPEVNPMMGTRGIRLGVVRPTLYRMQVRAICRAAEARIEQGGSPRVEVLVPMVMDPSEMALARSWLADALAASPMAAVLRGLVHVGAMIETPRAALLAGDIAAITDAVSFGTNDLTQLVFGLSRDDTAGTMLAQYLEQGLLSADPFTTIDPRGVGRLVSDACDAVRQARADVSITVCGEHGGDPASIELLARAGVNVFSCSPRRVPIARLAVAQALLRRGQASAVPSTPFEPTLGPPPTPRSDEGLGALVLHGLRVKGVAASGPIAELIGIDEAAATCELEALANAEQAKFLAKRSLWQITPAGRARADELVAALGDELRARLQRPYGDFLTLNAQFKQLCTDWQVRDGVPNDHSDAAYDSSCVARLSELHDTVQPVLADLAAAVIRFAHYRSRLHDAWSAVVAGSSERFTGVMKRSYHDVWMELHQDLLLLLAIDRVREGSF